MPPAPEFPTAWIFENSQKTFIFDPIRGYRLTQIPAQHARLTNGTVEYVGTYVGNVQGSPDQHNFSIRKTGKLDKRYLIFAASMTSAQFLKTNWPDQVEKMNIKK